jgi:hypothetical protein
MVGQHLHFDERGAGAALSGTSSSFALQPKDLSVDKAGRDFHVERAAIRQCQALVGAGNGLDELDRKPVVQILAPHVGARPWAAFQ